MGAIDPTIFEELHSFRSKNEKMFGVESHQLWRRAKREVKVRQRVNTMREELVQHRIGWMATSSFVLPNNTQLLPGWHIDDDGGVVLAFDALPTEVLCIELEEGELSCEKPDLMTNPDTWRAICQASRDDQKLLAIPGLQIVPLQTNHLNCLSPAAFHRGAVNHTEDPILRGIIAMYP